MIEKRYGYVHFRHYSAQKRASVSSNHCHKLLSRDMHPSFSVPGCARAYKLQEVMFIIIHNVSKMLTLCTFIGLRISMFLNWRLEDFVSTRIILIDEQFGFHSKTMVRPTSVPPRGVLGVHGFHVLVGLNRPKLLNTGTLFFNIAKAFHKVRQNGLIFKLFNSVVPDSIMLIFRDILFNRSFWYLIKGIRSSLALLRLESRKARCSLRSFLGYQFIRFPGSRRPS